MPAILLWVGRIFLGSLLKRILVGAGLAIVSGAGAYAVINFYVNKLQSAIPLLGDMAVILKLAGFDVAVSIIIGAIIVKASMSAGKLALKAAKK